MKLYDLMQEKSYSIRRLAKEAKVGATTINYIINGRDGQPHYASTEVRRKISTVLGVEAINIDEFKLAIGYYQGKGQPVRSKITTGNLTSTEITALSLAS